MGTIADRNNMDLTEAGDIKKMWPEYTEQYKKALNDHGGVIIHLEPDILECEGKWAIGRYYQGIFLTRDGTWASYVSCIDRQALPH